MSHHVYIGIALAAVMALSIFVDFFLHKDGEKMEFREAVTWSIFWVAISCVFGAWIWMLEGAEAGGAFFSGYLLEKSLSVDNLMVFVAIFGSFGIKSDAVKHKVLLCGIAGALFFRACFVGVGEWLMSFGPVVEVAFGLFVGYSGYLMLKADEDEEVDYNTHWACGPIKKRFPMETENFGSKFFIRKAGKLCITPLLLCLVVIELSDVAFSFDSVPAVLAVSRDTLIVYSAMMLAILGLRSLFFVINALVEKIPYLKYAVIFVLFFIAAKLIAGAVGYHVGSAVTLLLIGVSFTLATIIGLVKGNKDAVQG